MQTEKKAVSIILIVSNNMNCTEMSSDIPEIFKVLLEHPFSFPNGTDDGKCLKHLSTDSLQLAYDSNLLTVTAKP